MEQRNRLIHVERSVNNLGEAMTGLDSKLDAVVTALTSLTARQELHKPTDWVRAVSVGIGVAVGAVSLFGASVGAITYVVNAVNSETRTAMRKDIDFLTQRVERGWGIGAVTTRDKGDTSR
ncbi:MAG TPA: hypothetical protein VMT30_02450 [Candidatus Saccharimonadia bacterium]|nr:hypothetical protein [Candidatus Saccharimonadia bacterium]